MQRRRRWRGMRRRRILRSPFRSSDRSLRSYLLCRTPGRVLSLPMDVGQGSLLAFTEGFEKVPHRDSFTSLNNSPPRSVRPRLHSLPSAIWTEIITARWRLPEVRTPSFPAGIKQFLTHLLNCRLGWVRHVHSPWLARALRSASRAIRPVREEQVTCSPSRSASRPGWA